MIVKRLPDKIQSLRKAKHLSQKIVAKAIGVSEAMYSRIENGERAIQCSQIEAIANFLGAEREELRSLNLADKLQAETVNYSKNEVNSAIEVLRSTKTPT